jgi:[ribosomal protein S5]-alanine N-acetyltransferase
LHLSCQKSLIVDTVLFTTPRLRIRNLRDSDLEAFLQYRSNPEITKYQGFDTFTKEQAKVFIEEHKNKLKIFPGEWIQYGIEDLSDQQLVGDCAIYLHQSDSRIAETGITISHVQHRKGYAKESMLGMMNFLFEEKGIHRIVETVDAENTASIAMLKSLSFRLEGHFLENIFFKGKWGSEYQFAMLKREWEIRLIR